jgi:aminopeptidase N
MVKEFAPKDQVLHIDLSGRDPDEGSTELPYEKGALFLRQLEQAVGREKFDAFLRSYFGKFRFRSITTKDFLDYLTQNLLAKNPATAKKVPMKLIEEWVYKPGLPESAPNQRRRSTQLLSTEWKKLPKRSLTGRVQPLNFLRNHGQPRNGCTSSRRYRVTLDRSECVSWTSSSI